MRGELVLVRWSVWSLRNQLRRVIAEHGRLELLSLGVASLLLVAWLLSRMDGVMQRGAPLLWAHRGVVLPAAVVVLAVAGVMAGWRRVGGARLAAASPWVAVLPMSPGASARAIGWLALMGLPWQAGLVVLVAGWVSLRAGDPVAAAHAGLAALLFAGGFVAGVLVWGRSPARDAAGAGPRVAPGRGRGWRWPRALLWLDRTRPAWIGLWDCGAMGRTFWAVAVGAFGVLGGASVGAGLAQRWSWPMLGVALLGGNIVFMTALRGVPLRSPVCRASPLGFWAAWTGLLHVPLALSALWFAPLALVASLVTPGGTIAAAATALVLVGADLAYAVVVAFSPGARLFSVVIYVGLLATTAYETFELGQTAPGLLVAFLGVLFWLGRRRYRFGR